MDIISNLSKVLSTLGYNLFSKKQDKIESRKQRFADLLESIAECVEEIGMAISKAKHPISQCSELTVYLKNIQLIAEEVIDKETASKIMFSLYHIEMVPGIAKINLEQELKLKTIPNHATVKREKQSQHILEQAGSLKAIANLTRVH